jgi:imidazole glycerol-phosphate synthase subunit HisH
MFGVLMETKVVVIDYDVGNLLSVVRALQYLNVDVVVTNEKKIIDTASYLILPGVGAFGKAMDELKSSNVLDSIYRYIETDNPFMGICLGMQLMLERSCEFGNFEGIGIIGGGVVPIPERSEENDRSHKIPHIGWNNIFQGNSQNWKGTILDNLGEDPSVYFIHSYMANLNNSNQLLASCDYDGCRIPAVIADGNRYGCQFHPEKSGKTGLKILENFINL